jgi:uncharacterized phage protein (TIGR02218 family)
MKAVSSALQSLFETDQFVSCDLYTFTLAGGGASVTLTSADQNIAWNGITYSAMGPLIDRSAISQKTGLQVTQVKIDLYPTASQTINGLPWSQAVFAGMLDGASVTIQRAFGTTWAAGIAGAITMMAGRVGDITIGRSKMTIEVNSWTEILTNQMPRQYYQSACRHVLFGTACGAAKVTYDVGIAGNVSLGAFDAANPGNFPQNWFAYGTVTMISGAAQGQTRSILYSAATGSSGLFLQLVSPLTIAPSIGDVLALTPGCDKTMATCQSKFNNLTRFGGFPYIPAPEVAL